MLFIYDCATLCLFNKPDTHFISIRVIVGVLVMPHCMIIYYMIVHYFIWSCHYYTLCLFLHHPKLINITCISVSFVVWEYSICFCFIACHNFLFPVPSTFSFMYMTAIYLIRHPPLTIYYWYFSVFCSDSSIIRNLYFFLYVSLLFLVFPFVVKTSKGQLILC